MTDRHQELRRQHELLREHLAWLELEIARESATDSPLPVVPASPISVPTTMGRTQTTSLPAEDTDALLTTYAADERHNPESTKRGCLLTFAIALGLLLAGVAATYFFFYSKR